MAVRPAKFRQQRAAGSLGGKQRAKNQTAEERTELARAAANARWDKWRKSRGKESVMARDG